jgi:predicted neuraminidase
MIPYQQYEVTAQEQSVLKHSGKYIWNADIDHVNAGVLVCDSDFSKIDHRGNIPISLLMNGVKRWQWPEPTLARLNDGRLTMLVRINHTGRLHQAFSEDEGKTWTSLEPTNLKNPGNKPKLIAMPGGKIALLNTFSEGSAYIDRQPLAVWITDDDMATWSYQETLVTFPGWHSYPDGIVDDDGTTILLAFEFNRHDIYFVEHRTR